MFYKRSKYCIFFQESDFVVVTCSYSPEHLHMFDKVCSTIFLYYLFKVFIVSLLFGEPIKKAKQK